MRLAWATDLHLNFVDPTGVERFCRSVEQSEADRLLISGDIAESHNVRSHLEHLADRLDRPIDFVLGNHDFYHGRIDNVRREMEALSRSSRRLCWLPSRGVIAVAPGVALIGHDGWGDGRLGNFLRSRVRLNDYRLIGELSGHDWAALGRQLAALGDEAASFARSALTRALDDHATAIFVTHVPPFRESCPHSDRFSEADWLPHFSCGAVGEALVEIMASRPDRRLLVLCGHVHRGGTARILPNLTVETGPAEYGRPEIVRVFSIPEDIDSAGAIWSSPG